MQELAEEFEKRRGSPEDEDGDGRYLRYWDEDRDKDAEGEENWLDGDDPEDIKMENMIVLAEGYESGGRAITLDVFKANIYEDILKCSGLRSEVPIECYFDDLKTKFENLEMVPVPGDGWLEGELYEDSGDVEDVDDDEEDESSVGSNEDVVQQYKKIYQSFNWPDETHRKEEAIAAIRAHARRRDDAMYGGEEE